MGLYLTERERGMRYTEAVAKYLGDPATRSAQRKAARASKTVSRPLLDFAELLEAVDRVIKGE